MVIQKLCIQLGEDGKDINKNIGSPAKKVLPPAVQKALDIVRVIGNESVHPGQIDLNDDPNITSKLVELVNIIASRTDCLQEKKKPSKKGWPIVHLLSKEDLSYQKTSNGHY